MERVTIQDSINNFIIEGHKKKLSKNTLRAYKMGCRLFIESVIKVGINPEISPITVVHEGLFKNFISETENLAPKSARLYTSVVKQWFSYIIDFHKIPITFGNLQKITNDSLPQDIAITPTDPDFDKVHHLIKYVLEKDASIYKKVEDKLRFLRDRAIILTLSYTGLSVETLCTLNWENVDIKKKNIIFDPRKNQNSITLNKRTLQALIDYQKERFEHEPMNTKSIRNEPIFTQHRNQKNCQHHSITPRTIRKIIEYRAKEVFTDKKISYEISPIWLRLYSESFRVTPIGEILHPKITDRCIDLLEDGHYENAVFDAMKVLEEEVRKKANLSNSDYGVNLVSQAMAGGSPKITFSSVSAEQEAAYALFRGAIGYFKNPSSHRFNDDTDDVKARQCLAFASMLMSMLEETK